MICSTERPERVERRRPPRGAERVRPIPSDLVCFSHLRWDGVFQRPNHLMTRAARDRRVFWVEEPLPGPRAELTMRSVEGGIVVVSPWFPDGLDQPARWATLAALMDRLFVEQGVDHPRLWYYAPLMAPWTRHLAASAVVWDVMDDLAGFRGAPPILRERESELRELADVVFAGGHTLFEAKRGAHPNVHAFPSGVDARHFAQARDGLAEPADQLDIPRPRLGYFGVIDERLDLALIDDLARARPDWSIVLIGPTAKIEPEDLPRRANVHLLGQKAYDELPAYLAGWDVALMPFARNQATASISPTKTPEYLAGGRPVVSTPVADVVRPYGERGLVRIANGSEAFAAECEAALAENPAPRRAAADAFLADQGWDTIWAAMDRLADEAAGRRTMAWRRSRDALAPIAPRVLRNGDADRGRSARGGLPISPATIIAGHRRARTPAGVAAAGRGGTTE
jgi:UDP-galactopyranose mutase